VVQNQNSTWQKIRPELDFSKLSDNYEITLRFTDAMVDVCAQYVGGANAARTLTILIIGP